MKKLGYNSRRIFSLSVSCLLIGTAIRASEVAVIAHPSVQTDSLDKKRLNQVYRCEVRSWDDGTKIKVWDLGERGETKETFYDYIGIRPSRMKSLWMKQLLTGEGEPPNEAETEDDMLKKVMNTPGSIGYVDKEMVGSGVKLLLLIDKKNNKKPDK